MTQNALLPYIDVREILRKDDLDAFKDALALGLNINADIKHPEGLSGGGFNEPLLTVAIREGAQKIFDHLLSLNVNVHKTDDYDRTPLATAILFAPRIGNGFYDKLIKAGAQASRPHHAAKQQPHAPT